ncbi:MAG: transglutaminase family protein [Lachnospiraceae bacterium]|nr:transglutaminase family protein [Lachnospiraceae bacterium]
MEEQKKLKFAFSMNVNYSEPVHRAFFTLKCIPTTNARQKLLELHTEIHPDNNWSRGVDGFGNEKIYGKVDWGHDAFSYRVSGVVEIGQILYEEMADESKIPIFRHPYGMNRAGEGIRSWFEEQKGDLEGLTDYEKVLELMHRLHKVYSYEGGKTNVTTTAEEAWKTGAGVCQDYAHIFIALCHLAGIPARYVAGMLMGEGASHAWVEFLWKNRWIGIDPTNDILVADQHIKLAHGRDASDCLINRGILQGGGLQEQSVKVSVHKIRRLSEQ